MRTAVVALALAVLLAEPAAAAVPKRACDSRAEGSRPLRQLVSAGDLQIGPVAFHGLARLADAREFERAAPPTRGRYLIKTPLKVRAGRVVTVSIARAHRDLAGLTFLHDASLATGVPAVKFVACDKRERAFSYDGVVGPVTAFPGGFSLAEPGCVSITVRVRGRREPYTRLVPFGVGTCGRV